MTLSFSLPVSHTFLCGPKNEPEINAKRPTALGATCGGLLFSFSCLFCFFFIATTNNNNKKKEKMFAQRVFKMYDACFDGRVGEVQQLLKEEPILLNIPIDEVSFFFFFFLFFCFLFFVFVFILFPLFSVCWKLCDVMVSASPLFLYEKTTQMKWGRASFDI